MGNAEKSSSSSAENPSLLAGRNWFERLLVSFIAKRTPKCREVVRLLSQSMEVKLPLTTRIKIRFHYLICVWCQRYGEQLQALADFSQGPFRWLTVASPEEPDGTELQLALNDTCGNLIQLTQLVRY